MSEPGSDESARDAGGSWPELPFAGGAPDLLPRLKKPLGRLLIWVLVLGLVTGLLWWFQGSLDRAHLALAYLLVVLAGSATGGRLVGIILSLVCFLAFNFFLIPPFYTLGIHERLDWWVLLAFLVTGMVAAELFHHALKTQALAERIEVLREADRTKDAVLASVSHDLRTPLTTIRAMAFELRETGDERAAVIEEEAERLNQMVSDLLDLSRIRIGALPVTPELNAGEDLLGAALAQLRGVGGEERIRVRLPPDGSVPLGRFDFVQALRALSNLLENALRHSPPDKPVEVVVGREGEELLFRVSDSGPGVPTELRDRIFEPFIQAGDREKGGEVGSAGLGLAIARRVAEAQGGSLDYAPRPGGGSVFELRLPGADFPVEP